MVAILVYRVHRQEALDGWQSERVGIRWSARLIQEAQFRTVKEASKGNEHAVRSEEIDGG
jgi:hypothetical protein